MKINTYIIVFSLFVSMFVFGMEQEKEYVVQTTISFREDVNIKLFNDLLFKSEPEHINRAKIFAYKLTEKELQASIFKLEKIKKAYNQSNSNMLQCLANYEYNIIDDEQKKDLGIENLSDYIVYLLVKYDIAAFKEALVTKGF